ncbi:aerobic phenylacetate-CoA ligase [Oryzomicrobium terrae]|uniref:Aerobic phenylacetate-CoA ligase n=1 Tax=Oryzomicrobium terrae TaxID=1735038 RepID=A0A5C1EBL1_9RHOO|nr:AMP-binding protein [Oryzomicrobium terrae]QEL66246.1 aerobic phenylacetate-CoA ligase [Oryzomicrobium terrae]
MPHYDSLETRDPAERERSLFDRLPSQVAYAKQHAPYFAEILAGVDPADIHNRAALAALPVTHKSDLIERQKAAPPFGGLAATPLGNLRHVYCSPGPILEPEGKGQDPWRMARALYAAGFRPGDLVHNSFSFHFTPGAFIFAGGIARLGCPMFPAGVGQTEQQVEAITLMRPAGYVGTPSFLKIIADKADEQGADISSLKTALVSGEALLPAVRKSFQERGLQVLQCYATADLGLIAYETPAMEGMVIDEDIIVEIVRPGTGDPVAEGEVGEVVVTTFNPDYPLIRFATGDMSAVLPGISPCGRTNTRIKGWMGRADQTTKIKGMFVHPSQVAALVKRHPEVRRARIVVDNASGQDNMVVHCEVESRPEGLAEALVGSVRDITKLRGEVLLTTPGTLPNDGKVIEDARKYD